MNHVEVKIVNGKFTPMLYLNGRFFQLVGFLDYNFSNHYAKDLAKELNIDYRDNSKFALTGED